ncbi:Uncharacterised protein [Mycobacteroides abscessus subsp. abscessus]|nr:Uncharacterised protein [Mycobacteroides abscessus subsp. abscessus]SKK59374.1 Uncharacterised protein [Mycobacteroides abscessus subsp. abscessus]
MFGDEGGEFKGIGLAAVLLGEHATGDLAADVRAHVVVDGRCGGQAQAFVVGAECLGARLPVLRCLGVDREWSAQLRDLLGDIRMRPCGNSFRGDRRGVGVLPEAEQCLHLFGGYLRTFLNGPVLAFLVGERSACRIIEVLQTPAHPAARRFAFGVVVVRERHPAFFGAVLRSDLPGQVLVPVPGGQLVTSRGHAHRIAGVIFS